MTLLEIVKEFCRRQALPVPQIVTTSGDEQLLQIMGLLNELIDDLQRFTWTSLQYEATWTSAASGDQGAITTLAPNGFFKILNETIFDRTDGRELYGPRSASTWQSMKASNVTGPFYSYRIRGGHLITIPDMPAGHDMAFEYVSNHFVQAADLSTKGYFTADSDTFLLPDVLLLLGLRWRWKAEKGLPYQEEQRIYETRLAEEAGGDGTKPVIHMDDTCPGYVPGIFVPAGNWNL